jgi:hypothetical protein
VRVTRNWSLNRTAATPQDRVQIFQGPEERVRDWILATGDKRQETHLDWMDPTGTQQQLPPLLKLTAHVKTMACRSQLRENDGLHFFPLAIVIQCYWFTASISAWSMPRKA